MVDERRTGHGSGLLGVVAIGRNEGERLVACLDSLGLPGASVVYVDSGSSDGSVAMAQRKGAEVVTLDMGRPFTAARARNAGATGWIVKPFDPQKLVGSLHMVTG